MSQRQIFKIKNVKKTFSNLINIAKFKNKFEFQAKLEVKFI